MKKRLIASLLSCAGLIAASLSIIYLAWAYTNNVSPSYLNLMILIANGVFLIVKGNQLRIEEEQEEVLEAFKELYNRSAVK